MATNEKMRISQEKRREKERDAIFFSNRNKQWLAHNLREFESERNSIRAEGERKFKDLTLSFVRTFNLDLFSSAVLSAIIELNNKNIYKITAPQIAKSINMSLQTVILKIQNLVSLGFLETSGNNRNREINGEKSLRKIIGIVV